MTTPPRRDTAKIYQFPVRQRPSGGGSRLDRTVQARLVCMSDHGAAWYHEAAIQEDLRGRKP